jgi:hypothetical protein
VVAARDGSAILVAEHDAGGARVSVLPPGRQEATTAAEPVRSALAADMGAVQATVLE